MTRLIIGCGYLGQRVALAWRRRGDDVWALTRSTDHARSFAESGIHAVLGDVLNPTSLTRLPAAETVLSAVGYDRSAAPSKREVYVDGLHHLLRALAKDSGRLIYVSSSSVYGQAAGEWVDEASPCEPTSDGGRICLAAEQLARTEFRGSGGVSVLRLSGIYGPGRLAARVDALRRQQPIAGHPDGWLNLIHVDDAREAVQACADLDTPLPTLLVSDDRPLRRRDYYDLLTSAIGAPPAVFADHDASTDRGKRCSNRLLHELLGLELSYSTIDAGLPTALTELK